MNKIEESVKVAEFTENEINLLLNDVDLQSERLINIQKKSGILYNELYKSAKIMSIIAKFNKSRVLIGFIFILFILTIGFYLFVKRFSIYIF